MSTNGRIVMQKAMRLQPHDFAQGLSVVNRDPSTRKFSLRGSFPTRDIDLKRISKVDVSFSYTGTLGIRRIVKETSSTKKMHFVRLANA